MPLSPCAFPFGPLPATNSWSLSSLSALSLPYRPRKKKKERKTNAPRLRHNPLPPRFNRTDLPTLPSYPFPPPLLFLSALPFGSLHLHTPDPRFLLCAPEIIATQTLKQQDPPKKQRQKTDPVAELCAQVIKALYDYTPEPGTTQELAFSKGDFFHVISREDDSDWYEACNPLIPSARGLVPVSFFEVIGKNERDSGGSVDLHKKEHHDSGFSDRNPSSDSPTNTTRQGAFRMSALGKGQGAMVYGIVQYDFQAERPDELDARAGEAIIVIAQSNPEWFVAKPIGRLGGPGLIPVSFIELRDMQSGQAVTDPLEAVRRAGVPKVEEWKKMTAEYKNSSITLGKLEPSGGGVVAVTAGMDKMSMSGSHQSASHMSQNGNSYVSRGPLG